VISNPFKALDSNPDSA